MYLIDTNVISELPKRNPDARVVAWFAEQESIALSAITVVAIEEAVDDARVRFAEIRVPGVQARRVDGMSVVD